MLREEIKYRLMQWRDETANAPVVEDVYRREELHQGPFADRVPDVIFTARDEAYVGFGGHEFGNNALMRSSPLFNAHHRMDGMVALHGPGIRRGARLDTHSILDMAPTILYLLGYPIPAEMDGQVLTQAFQPEFLSAHEKVTVASVPSNGKMPDVITPSPDGVYSTSEEGEVLERLKDLGYA
jgi:predicted AlkP superfamily phosphohydrolase/phosphomutase